MKRIILSLLIAFCAFSSFTPAPTESAKDNWVYNLNKTPKKLILSEFVSEYVNCVVYIDGLGRDVYCTYSWYYSNSWRVFNVEVNFTQGAPALGLLEYVPPATDGRTIVIGNIDNYPTANIANYVATLNFYYN